MSILDKILYYLICLYIILLPLLPNNINFLGRTIPPSDAILALVILLYLLKLILDKSTKIKFVVGLKDFFTSILSIFMLALVIAMFVSISYAYEKRLALTESARFVTYIALFFIVKYDTNLEKHIKGFTNSYIFTTFFICLFGIYQYFTGFGLSDKFKNYEYTKVKVAATLDNPNNLGAFLILSLFPIIMLSIYEKNRKKKIFFITLSFMISVNLILTGSRNALIGIVVGITVLAILYSRKLFMALIALGIGGLFVPQIKYRVMAMTDKTQNQSRVYLWEIGKKMIIDHPIFGVGNGNYVSLYDKYTDMYPEFKFYGYSRFACHNSYLKVESELGIIGGISFITILLSALFRVKKYIVTSKDGFYKYFYVGFIASMIAFYVMNLLDNLFFVPKTTTYFWLLLAMCEALMFNRNKSM